MSKETREAMERLAQRLEKVDQGVTRGKIDGLYRSGIHVGLTMAMQEVSEALKNEKEE